LENLQVTKKQQQQQQQNIYKTTEAADFILKYEYSSESFPAMLSCGTACCAEEGGSNF